MEKFANLKLLVLREFLLFLAIAVTSLTTATEQASCSSKDTADETSIAGATTANAKEARDSCDFVGESFGKFLMHC